MGRVDLTHLSGLNVPHTLAGKCSCGAIGQRLPRSQNSPRGARLTCHVCVTCANYKPNLHRCVYIYIHTYVLINTHTYIYICTYVNICVCIYIYIYTHYIV